MSDLVPKPEITHLGKTQGRWPIVAFSDEHGAAYWATHGNADEPRYVWAVLSIELGPRLGGVLVPEYPSLEEVDVNR